MKSCTRNYSRGFPKWIKHLLIEYSASWGAARPETLGRIRYLEWTRQVGGLEFYQATQMEFLETIF